MKISANILGGLKRKMQNLPWFLASRAFLLMVLLILLALSVAGICFYQYAMLPAPQQQDVLVKNAAFRYTGYEKILNDWQVKEKNAADSQHASYLNPFVALPQQKNDQ